MYLKQLIIGLLLTGNALFSQDLLQVEDAVKIALENNFAIKIAKNNDSINRINNNIANAGMLPRINANFADNNSQIDTEQTQADGSIRALDNAKNHNLSYGIGLDWTIFDGMKMFVKKEQLEIIEKQGKANLKAQIYAKISEVYTTYYNLVMQQQVLKAQDSALLLSNERLLTAQNRFTIGKASKLEVLNAQVDFNADKSSLMKQKESFKTLQIQLNLLLNRSLDIDFKVVDEINTSETLDLASVMEKAKSQNPQLQAQILAKKLADLSVKEIKSDRYPTIRVTSGYNFTRSEASLGFITQSSGQGFVYGVAATVPLFNGFLQNKREKIAKISAENANLLLEEQNRNLEAIVQMLFTTFQTNLELADIESKNLEIAKENLDITLAKYKIGTLTPVEFRTAQQNYLEANLRFSNSQFLAKITEIRLKEISGTLKIN